MKQAGFYALLFLFVLVWMVTDLFRTLGRLVLVGEGSGATRAAMNDSPVDCQNREWTEPQRDLCTLPLDWYRPCGRAGTPSPTKAFEIVQILGDFLWFLSVFHL